MFGDFIMDQTMEMDIMMDIPETLRTDKYTKFDHYLMKGSVTYSAIKF